MKAGSFVKQLTSALVGGLAIVGAPAVVFAQGSDARVSKSHHEGEFRGPTNDLVRVVREATERFRDVSVAEAEGYHLAFGCVSGSDSGAMGLHYVNMSLVGDPELDPTRPEIVIYEAQPNGRLKMTGADFLVLAADWERTHSGPPQIMGQLLHLFEAPNRFGLPPFYTLHVWAWKENPNGAFVNWHPNVSCDSYSAQND